MLRLAHRHLPRHSTTLDHCTCQPTASRITGLPVLTADGTPLGTVQGMTGRYVRIEEHTGRTDWLGIECIRSTGQGQVKLGIRATDLDRYREAGPAALLN
jgi:hypothetical protein